MVTVCLPTGPLWEDLGTRLNIPHLGQPCRSSQAGGAPSSEQFPYKAPLHVSAVCRVAKGEACAPCAVLTPTALSSARLPGDCECELPIEGNESTDVKVSEVFKLRQEMRVFTCPADLSQFGHEHFKGFSPAEAQPVVFTGQTQSSASTAAGECRGPQRPGSPAPGYTESAHDMTRDFSVAQTEAMVRVMATCP